MLTTDALSASTAAGRLTGIKANPGRDRQTCAAASLKEVPLTPELRGKILSILARHNNMTLATMRPDGYPQATTVGYANDGMTIYFGCGANAQKVRNIAHDPRVSAAIDEDHANWNEIEGISFAGKAERVTDRAELDRVASLFLAKFPQIAAFSANDRASTAIYRIEPHVMSVLDYTKDFGHHELVTLEPTIAANPISRSPAYEPA